MHRAVRQDLLLSWTCDRLETPTGIYGLRSSSIFYRLYILVHRIILDTSSAKQKQMRIERQQKHRTLFLLSLGLPPPGDL